MEETAQINEIFRSCGIEEWGVCPFWAVKDALIPCRAMARIPEGAASILCVLFPYLTPEPPARNLSRYAVVPDYHLIANQMLGDACKLLSKQYSDYEFQHFVDNSPIPEVRAAATAGLGVMGKNGLLIHKTYGSWVFLGEIVTDLPLPATLQTVQACQGCGACEKACPTGALKGGAVDKTKCLSAVTQQKKPLSPAEAEKIRESGCVWGCDRCQEVCPMNRGAEQTPIRAFLEGAMPIADEETIQREDRAYLWRGRQVILRNLALWEKKEGPS